MALIDAVNKAKAALRVIGKEHRLFSVKFGIVALFRKLNEKTQARWYLVATRCWAVKRKTCSRSG